MRTTNFSAIATAQPINRDASRARDMKGEHFDVTIPPTIAHWKSPPPTTKRWQPVRSGYADLTGLQVGRLRVVRFHGITGAKRYVWLVRCTCGDYELRRGESLAKAAAAGGSDDACYICKHTDRLRDQAAQPSTPASREASAKLLEAIASRGQMPAKTEPPPAWAMVTVDPSNRVKWNVRTADRKYVFDPGVWDRWVADQAAQAINKVIADEAVFQEPSS